MDSDLTLNGQDRGRFGAVYVAFGTPHLAMALLSASTLRHYNPDLAIHIISNRSKKIAQKLDFWDTDTDSWDEIDDAEKNNRTYKTGLHSYVKFDRAVYLDADTLVTGSISLGFKYLDYFDFAARAQRGRQKHSRLADIQLSDDGMTAKDLPQWNGGVVFFRNNEECRDLFQNWQRIFDDIGEKFDQPALAKAIIESQCRILTLDERWNGGFQAVKDDKGGMPLVAHYHSALDQKIEGHLRAIGRTICHDTPGDAVAEIEHFISRCRRIRKKGEPLKSLARRIYRISWHRKHGPL